MPGEEADLLTPGGKRLLALLGALAMALPASAASRSVSTGEVVAAAKRCTLEGVTIRREGRRKFAVAHREPVTTTVTFVDGPVPAEVERAWQADDEARMRPWNCLVKWGEKRRILIHWPPPPLIIYD